MSNNNWLDPPALCTERTLVLCRGYDNQSGELTCVLAAGHEPPHWDDDTGIYWSEPKRADNVDDDPAEGTPDG
jgi:hypothetical protein